MLQTYIKENLKKEFITFSFFKYVSLVLFVRKPNEDIRMYIDYQELNNLIKKNRYSISLIDEIITRVIKIKIYIKFNII